jgi:hypothetical protein
MIAWRLCRRRFADFSGEGAHRFGGRWNSPSRAVVYFAEHPALADFELRVHLDLPFDLLPVDFVLMRVMVPEAELFGLHARRNRGHRRRVAARCSGRYPGCAVSTGPSFVECLA